MSNKSNAALALDRESVAAFAGLTKAIATEADAVRGAVSISVSYIQADENMVGGDSDSIKELAGVAVDNINTICSKLTVAQAVALKMAGHLGTVSGSSNLKISEALDEVSKAIAKVKAAGAVK